MKEWDQENYEELKSKAELLYRSIGKVRCPALKAEITFNSDGFHHLRYDGSRAERNKKVQMFKFIFLEKAIDVLSKSTTIQEYRNSTCPVGKPNKNGFREIKTVEWFGFTAVTSFSKHIRIKVIVRRVGGSNGQYHFWSVMPFWALSNNKRITGSKTIEDE